MKLHIQVCYIAYSISSYYVLYLTGMTSVLSHHVNSSAFQGQKHEQGIIISIFVIILIQTCQNQTLLQMNIQKLNLLPVSKCILV